MRLRGWVVSVVSACVIAGGGLFGVPVASAAPWAAAASAAPAANRCSDAYFNGDSRLGPEQLPARGEILPIVQGYHRFGSLTAPQFLATYWDPTAGGGKGGWRYPPDNGFLLGPMGKPIEYPLPLAVGQEVDRFGSEFGGFLAPRDTPYSERALPPQSLDNFDPTFTCNYHLYKVVKSFEAESGPIAPGFAQPGHGRQYQIVGTLLPGHPARANIMWLIGHGYLQRVSG